ncbi:MAG: MerR family transcriptional regulator [Gammaproteobacteria bacterium]|nr:MerR family transcriptional regulator [Gammaproteobacteria bacterium]
MIACHNIGEVSRRSGIPKDLLRQWERRYGYPDPQRDENGDRCYTNRQLDKLLLIRQLVDQGRRPGKLINLQIPELEAMLESPKASFHQDELIRLLKSGSVIQLEAWFESLVSANGLRSFVHRVIAPASIAVGEAWSTGELAIYEEHLFTEVMKRLARQFLAAQPLTHDGPRVMLTTVPGEQHSLGLLMVEIILRLGGAEVIAFGTEMPFKEIRETAQSHQVQVIGLSFSGSFKTEDALVMLRGLRQSIPAEIRIWAGGAALDKPIEAPMGVALINDLQKLEHVVAGWQPVTAPEHRAEIHQPA